MPKFLGIRKFFDKIKEGKKRTENKSTKIDSFS